MGDSQDGGVTFPPYMANEFLNRFTLFGVEMSRRFVKDENGSLSGQVLQRC